MLQGHIHEKVSLGITYLGLLSLSQGKSEFLGRTIAKPHVKLDSDAYIKPNFPPLLEWYDIHRGSEHAGELLATFELLQVSKFSH